MATSSDVLCSICEAQHTIKNADYWCPECEEGLCSECQKLYEEHNFNTLGKMALEFQKICYLDNHKEELSDTAMETWHGISDLEEQQLLFHPIR
jgi:hypothetical protein